MTTPENTQELLLGSEPASEETLAPATGKHTDTVPGIEEQIRQLELLAAEHYDAWLRAKAEGENIRRRAREDISKAHKFAVEKFASELLAVKDSLEAALAVPEQTAESFKAGVELTLKQLISAFEKNAPVSYTHLDVYKRQMMDCSSSGPSVPASGLANSRPRLTIFLVPNS